MFPPQFGDADVVIIESTEIRDARGQAGAFHKAARRMPSRHHGYLLEDVF